MASSRSYNRRRVKMPALPCRGGDARGPAIVVYNDGNNSGYQVEDLMVDGGDTKVRGILH